jgi:hypothetical protein
MQATAVGLELYTRMHIATRLAEATAERRAKRLALTPQAPRGGASAFRTWGRTLLTPIRQGLRRPGSSELSIDYFPRRAVELRSRWLLDTLGGLGQHLL